MGLTVLVVWLASSGILWLPVAVFTTAYVARRQGFPTFNYAWKGACRSLCFILPWVRLIIRMHLTSPNSNYRLTGNVSLLLLVYALSAWLIFGIGFVLLLSIVKLDQLANLSDRTLHYEKVMIAVAIVGFIATLAGLIHWGYYTISIIRASTYRSSAALPAMESTHETATLTEFMSEHCASEIVFQRRLEAEYNKYSKPGWLARFPTGSGWLAPRRFPLSAGSQAILSV